MRTRSSSNLVGNSSSNPTTSNPKRRNRRRSNQRVKPFALEESPVVTMADQRTMAELLRAPTEGYAEAIVVPPILAEHFELKHSLINMMTSDQFFGLEKDNPHDHIPRRWLEKEPPRSITTWDDLFDESFHEAWTVQDLLRLVPHHGFHTELPPTYTFYNALTRPTKILKLCRQMAIVLKEVIRWVTIIENKSKVRNSRNKSFLSQVKSSDGNSSFSDIAKLTHAVNQQMNAVTTAMMDILKQFQATPPPASVKAVEEICVTCGESHLIISVSPPMATLSRSIRIIFKDTLQQPRLRNEMQNSIQASMSNQTNELKNMMASFFQMNTASTSGTGSLPSNTVANPKGELKAITTRSGLVLNGPTVPMPPPFINPEDDERVEETLTDPEHGEYTIKVPPPQVQKAKPPSQRNFVIHQRDPRYPHIPYPSRMNQEKQKEK
ncbi:hypothetical protein Tco_0742110 [Tanacetum coccineum]